MPLLQPVNMPIFFNILYRVLKYLSIWWTPYQTGCTFNSIQIDTAADSYIELGTISPCGYVAITTQQFLMNNYLQWTPLDNRKINDSNLLRQLLGFDPRDYIAYKDYNLTILMSLDGAIQWIDYLAYSLWGINILNLNMIYKLRLGDMETLLWLLLTRTLWLSWTMIVVHNRDRPENLESKKTHLTLFRFL